jgi:CRP-like cAMP-binding protein
MVEALIQKRSAFTRLSRADRDTLVTISGHRVRRIATGIDVISEGDKPAVVNLILEGWACRYKVLENGRRQIIAFFLPGDMCDLNIFVLKEMDHSIAALTPLTIAELTRQDMEEITLGHPRVTQALWWESLVAAAVQREWTVGLGQRDAFERLAHLFCELFLRLKIVGLTEGDTCPMPLTQQDIGDAMGLSAVHVNRTLQQLRAEGLIVLTDRTLTIPDMAALQAAGLFNANYLHLDHEDPG